MKTGKIIVSKHLSERLKDVMDRTSENVISDVSEKQSQPVNKKEDFSELNKCLLKKLNDKFPEFADKGFYIYENPVYDFFGCFAVLSIDNCVTIADTKVDSQKILTINLKPLADFMDAAVLNETDINTSKIIDINSCYVSSQKNSNYYIGRLNSPQKTVTAGKIRNYVHDIQGKDSRFYICKNSLINVGQSKCYSVVGYIHSSKQSIELTVNSIPNKLSGVIILKLEFPEGFDLYGKAREDSSKKTKKEYKDNGVFPSDLLLKMDNFRAKFPPLSPYRLKSVSEGSVEIMSGTQVPDGYVELKLDEECVARDPWELVQEGSIVSIDFGTTSTVVAFQNSSGYVELLRMKSFGKELSESDFENPTVLEFNNFQKFYDTWTNEDYRPLTEWNDVCASYDAREQLRDHASCGIANIKTWALKKHNSIPLRLEDEINKFPFELSPLDIDDDKNKDIGNWQQRPLDPIEVYGYYLGLFLNNQTLRGGAIYLDYRLTFPVDFDKETRNRIKQGLRRGILRSLPPSLVYSDKWQDARFNIELTATEPVALVSSIIPALGLDKDLEKPLAYAVFDFGGGTTDFSAGFYRRPTDEEADEHDNDITIQTLAVGGIKNLGGEHILDHLYYAVLKDNATQLMQNNISFVCPTDMNRFIGSDTLWGYGSDAYGNMYILRDRLRPVWENREADIQSIEAEGKLSIQFKNSSGDYVNVDLNVDCEALKKKIYELIRDGVISFFKFMCQAFKQANDKGIINNGMIERIHVLFSGNSCRTPILREVFTEQKERILNVAGQKDKNIDLDSIVEHYELIDQVGNANANAEKGVDQSTDVSIENFVVQNENEIKVTLKNCVALGLLRLVTSNIYTDNTYLNDSDNSVENEAPFDYSIGKFKMDFLNPVFLKNTPYNEWKFFDRLRKPNLGGEPSVQIGWSNSPLAASAEGGKVKRNGCKSTIVYFSPDYIGHNLYMRAVDPHKIEIACFAPDDTNCESPLQVKTVNL